MFLILANFNLFEFSAAIFGQGSIIVYIITKSMRALSLVNQLCFVVPVNPWKNRASSGIII